MNDSVSRVGLRFGPYQLRRLLGRGGMGEVYEAEDTRKHRIVALKLISPQFSTDATFRVRMRREADTAGRLTEAHIVPIHDYGDIDGQFYVEMRMIDGVSLRALLTNYGPLPPARTVAIMRQIAAALDAAHANGVTHRDVKPENILLTDDDFAYLVDFGIARAAADPGLTQSGVALGTYNYMAPERFTGDEVTYRSDIYALACVLGECLTGAPPYRADSVERLIAAHLLEPAPCPSLLRPGRIPPGLDAVIGKGMAKNPADRYFSAGDLAAAAHSALTAPEQQQEATILRQGEYATPARQRRGPRPDQLRRSGCRAGRGNYGPAGAVGRGRGRLAATGRGRRRRGNAGGGVIVGAAVLLAVAAAGTTVYLGTRPSAASKQQASGQTELPFTGIGFRLSPGGVALDKAGDVYVTSEGMYGRVVELAPGSGTPTVLPFSGLYQPQGLAVDNAGAVYVADFDNRVVKLTAGSTSQTVLPFTGLNYPEGVAVDGQGDVYVATGATTGW
ncbi:serine/threonine-protein kinase [Mycobacterium interjectum]|uniref:serine/threonine-protein kinase n=1 Tax=Mycobacterium interjectum TaxID=33895 RepID=UPI0021F3B83D